MKEVFDYMHEKDANYPEWYEMACWADDLKSAALGALDGWHFYNQPFYDGIDPNKATVIVNKDYNVVNTVVSLEPQSLG
jgi:hypothetical protein